MNRIPLQRIGETRPELYKPYAFYILLHEYFHSLGYLNEGTVRAKTLEITRMLSGRSTWPLRLQLIQGIYEESDILQYGMEAG
jgi:hypothetical protein